MQRIRLKIASENEQELERVWTSNVISLQHSFHQKPSESFSHLVAPECKKDQRIVYGAAFKSEVMVNCYVEANPMPHSFKWQFKTASKRRRTDLINTVGGAKALDEIKDMVDLPANLYSLEYDHSLLRFDF